MSEPTRPPEMELIESLRKQIRPAMSVRKAAESASISEGRWRSLAKGTHQVSKGTAVPTRAPADTLARMAQVVGATADQLSAVGREDAAHELETQENFQQDVLFPVAATPARTAEFSRAVELARQIVNATPTPHDEHFNRAERLLSHAHESVRRGDHLGAINGLEGVWSTVELLVDRITDEALLKGLPHADQSDSPATAPAQSDAQAEVVKDKEVTQSLLDLAARTVDDDKPE